MENAEGVSHRRLALSLDISTWTVGTHMRRVFAKLGVGSRASMLRGLLSWGIIENGKTNTFSDAGGRVMHVRAAG